MKTKEVEITEYRSSLQAITNKAADDLIERFDHIQGNDFSKRLQDSSRVDELIKLKNELEESQSKISILEQQISSLRRKKSVKKQDLSSNDRTDSELKTLSSSSILKESVSIGI